MPVIQVQPQPQAQVEEVDATQPRIWAINGSVHGRPDIVYTEAPSGVNVAAFLLWEAYYNYRVWAISPTLIGFIRQLDLTRVLGTQADAHELHQLLELIESTDWEFDLEANRSKASERRRDFSKGRVGAGGDCIWYNPNTRSVIPEQEARACSRAERVVPQGHPTGYAFDDNRPRASGWFPGAADQPELPPVEVEDDDNLTENTPSDDEVERDVRHDGGWRGAPAPRNPPQAPQAPRSPNVGPRSATPACCWFVC